MRPKPDLSHAPWKLSWKTHSLRILVRKLGPIINLWRRLDPAQPDLFQKIDSRGGLFCS